MKNNNFTLPFFILFSLSWYFTVVTDFPYIIYFFIVGPIIFVLGAIIYRFLGVDEWKEKKENMQKELFKKKKQDEWNRMPQYEKDKIQKGIEIRLKEKKENDAKQLKQQLIEKSKADKTAEENRLRTIKINQERENQEREKQERLKQEKETKEKEIIENRIIQIQKQKYLRESLRKNEIKRKILEKEKENQLESEAIQELIDAGLIDNNYYSGKNIRESIPKDVKIAVWNRDKERCVSCFNQTNLEFDHIIPVSKGGANSIKNIQLLCRNCNRTKSNKII